MSDEKSEQQEERKKQRKNAKKNLEYWLRLGEPPWRMAEAFGLIILLLLPDKLREGALISLLMLTRVASLMVASDMDF